MKHEKCPECKNYAPVKEEESLQGKIIDVFSDMGDLFDQALRVEEIVEAHYFSEEKIEAVKEYIISSRYVEEILPRVVISILKGEK